MTQRELKREIESTRESLNTAIKDERGMLEILYISRQLDDLIEMYMEQGTDVKKFNS